MPAGRDETVMKMRLPALLPYVSNAVRGDSPTFVSSVPWKELGDIDSSALVNDYNETVSGKRKDNFLPPITISVREKGRMQRDKFLQYGTELKAHDGRIIYTEGISSESKKQPAPLYMDKKRFHLSNMPTNLRFQRERSKIAISLQDVYYVNSIDIGRPPYLSQPGSITRSLKIKLPSIGLECNENDDIDEENETSRHTEPTKQKNQVASNNDQTKHKRHHKPSAKNTNDAKAEGYFMSNLSRVTPSIFIPQTPANTIAGTITREASWHEPLINFISDSPGDKRLQKMPLNSVNLGGNIDPGIPGKPKRKLRTLYPMYDYAIRKAEATQTMRLQAAARRRKLHQPKIRGLFPHNMLYRMPTVVQASYNSSQFTKRRTSDENMKGYKSDIRRGKQLKIEQYKQVLTNDEKIIEEPHIVGKRMPFNEGQEIDDEKREKSNTLEVPNITSLTESRPAVAHIAPDTEISSSENKVNIQTMTLENGASLQSSFSQHSNLAPVPEICVTPYQEHREIQDKKKTEARHHVPPKRKSLVFISPLL